MRIFLLSLFLCFCGCSSITPNLNENSVISAAELRVFLSKAGISADYGEIISDQFFFIPSENWLLDSFVPTFPDFLRREGVDKYKLNFNDCTSFAIAGRFYATKLYVTTEKSRNAGVCFGEICYYPDEGKGKFAHSINAAVLTKNGKLEMIYYDGTIQQTVVLSKTEIDSIFFYRF